MYDIVGGQSEHPGTTLRNVERILTEHSYSAKALFCILQFNSVIFQNQRLGCN